MIKLRQATRANQQLKFFGRKMFHSTYSKVKPRIKVVAKVKAKVAPSLASIGALQYEQMQQEMQLRNRALQDQISANRQNYASYHFRSFNEGQSRFMSCTPTGIGSIKQQEMQLRNRRGIMGQIGAASSMFGLFC